MMQHQSRVGGIGLSPDRMSADERLDEVARILAAGIRRARAKQRGCRDTKATLDREVSLDFTAPQRGHVTTKHRRGEPT